MISREVFFRRFTVGPYPINGYLIADRETRIGAFVDPGGFHDEIAKTIAEHDVKLRCLFLTHGHGDHTEGLSEFTKRYSPEGCYAGVGEVPEANHILNGGERLEVGNLRFMTYATPGHSPGGISFYCPGLVFTGDALFCGSLGGTSSADLAQLQVEHVRKHIFSLPESTLVYPAHGPMSTVAAEKYANPFFQPSGAS